MYSFVKPVIKSAKIENPTFVEIDDKVQISHYYAYCDKEETKLYEMLVHLDVESAIVFCERKEEVKKISKFLNENFSMTSQ